MGLHRFVFFAQALSRRRQAVSLGIQLVKPTAAATTAAADMHLRPLIGKGHQSFGERHL